MRTSQSQLTQFLAMIVLVASSTLRADVTFRDQVAPLLERRCLNCHNESDRKGDFSLQTSQQLRDSGFVEPGNPDESQLIRVVVAESHGERPAMPKDGSPLTDEEVGALRQWIAAGAEWPPDFRLTEPKVEDFDWWSLRPLMAVQPPVFNDTAALNWIRTPVDAFVLSRLRDESLAPSQEADRRTLIRRVTFDLIGLPPTREEIDSFINDSSPDAYERVVNRLLMSPHYGERWARHWLDVVRYADTCGYDKDKLRPNAWPYRDYVIRSFNDDKPYTRFVQEQIAGDVLFPGEPDGILGLGFIAAGPWDFIGHVEVSESKIDGMVARNLDRDDMVTGALNTFCSATIQCARCHNHKFDPFTQQHYYSLQSVFAAVDRAERIYDTDPVIETKRQELALPSGRMVYAAATHFEKQGNFRPTEGKPRPVKLLHRGNETQPGDEVRPGTIPLKANDVWEFQLPIDHSEADRRAALARWMTNVDHPLTWRSIVNRVWQYHFGGAIVDSPNDFGRMGQLPSHPALLDWLAVEFRDHGQSFKTLHRLIVSSAVYRQTSMNNPAAETVDAANRLLWRMNRRRLEAEEIRDSVLVVSGKLNPEMGGPGFFLFELEKPEHSPHYEYNKFDPDDVRSHRRSVYRFIVRSQPDPFMTTLDCADSSQSTPRRHETQTALQALSLLNNRFTLTMARHFSKRLESVSDSTDKRVDYAFQLLTGRTPSLEERVQLTTYADQHGLPALCRLLFNLSEFVFVD